MYVNGALSGARTGTSKFTAYVSPYMVVSQGGNYTKHVYMGSQRITSKVGNSGIFTTSPVNTTDLKPKLALQTTNIKERFDSLGVKYSGVQQTGGLISSSPSGAGGTYFYHPDHLGSSSLITNGSGDLVQHIQYVPFGEVFVEERNATWSTPYKFNGKEQDEETGLCYYGARYYDPRTSVWLSVDPLTEEKPSITGYAYCFNNPLNFIDPDGRDEWEVSKSGKDITWKKPSEKHTLHLIDEKGKRIKGKNVTVTDRKILDDLSISHPFTQETSEGVKYRDGDQRLAYFDLNSLKDGVKLFYFMARNTTSEWTLRKGEKNGKTSYGIGTYGFDNQSPYLFWNKSKTVLSIHSHPLPIDNIKIEFDETWGDRQNSKSKNTWTEYVLNKNSGRIWTVRNNKAKVYVDKGDYNIILKIFQ